MSLAGRTIVAVLPGTLLALALLFMWATPLRADQADVRLAQLNLELGSGSGCSGSAEKCRQRKHHGKERSQHKDRARTMDGGIGIILQVPPPSTVTRAKKKPAKTGTPTSVTPKAKKKPIAKPVKKPVAKDKPKPRPSTKPAAKTGGQGDDPKDKPLFVPPEFPAIVMRDCEDCWELWISILWYESIISEDSRKLFERRLELDERRAEIERLRGRIGSAGSVDRVYFNREIDRHVEYITSIEALNEELEKLVAEEWKILQERMDQYAECIDRHCPVPPVVTVTEDTALPPPPLPVSNPAPAYDPQPDYSTSDWGVKTTLGLDPLGGYKWSTDTGKDPPAARYRPPTDDRKICGPDITEAVLKTLRKMKEEFTAAEEKQAAACRSLIDPRTGGYAWDILELSPGVAVPQPLEGQNPHNYEPASDSWVQRDNAGKVISWKQPWFTGASHLCAIPREDPVCAPTVEFFGICEHAQVVNYVQWRFMLGLCGGAYPYVGPLLHKAWNLFQYGGGAPATSQSNMSVVSEMILDKLDEDPGATDFTDVREALKALDDARTDKPIKACKLSCGIKIEREFSYRWLGLNADRGQETVRLDRDLRAMGDAGVDKVKAKISQDTGVDVDKLRPGYVFDKALEAAGR